MSDMTPQEHFAKLIQQLAEAWRRDITTMTISAYYIGLKDVPIDDLEAAIVTAIKMCKFMPSVSELRSMTGIDAGHTDRAALAWAIVDKTMTEHENHSVVFDDPAITATVHNMGGWYHLSTIEDRKEWHTWTRKTFERVYSLLSASDLGAEQIAPSLGYFDKQNGTRTNVHPIETGLPWAIEFQDVLAIIDGRQDENILTDNREVPKIELKKPHDSTVTPTGETR